MRKLTFIIIMLTMALYAAADAVGTWRLFSSYSSIDDIQPAGNTVYVLASGNLYSHSITDNSIATYDQTTCLNSSDIKHIAWAQKAKKLIIAYADNTIDLLRQNGEATYITDIADKQMSGDKTINSIFIQDDHAYIATAFGIVKLNVKEEYIADSYILGYNVAYCYTEGQHIYAASPEEGIMRGRMTDNLLDKKQWTYHAPYTEKEKEQYITDPYNNCYWAADTHGRLAQFALEGGQMVQKTTGVCPDGPATNSCWRLYWHDGRLFATAGNYSYNIYKNNPGCVMIYDGARWTQLSAPDTITLGYKYRNANCMAFDPTDKTHYFVGSRSGIYEYRGMDCINAYNTHNSTVMGEWGSKDKERALITSMTIDSDGTLWAMNGWCNTPILSMSRNGEWSNHQHDEIMAEKLTGVDIQGTFISKTNGDMWFVNNNAHTSCLFRYDYKTDNIESYNAFYNQDGTTLSLPMLYNLAEDHDGNIWVATSGGPMIMTRADIEAGRFVFTQHKVPRNDGTNYADYLLNGVSVRCIAIDAANRKWMGTESNGVFLISDDNNTQEAHFNTENSPLLSDHVYDIAIDPATGQVYFSTEKGICSYQSDVTADNAEMNEDNVSVYPNPVTPDHTGDIKITGLAMKSRVKITTSSGALVSEGISSGGTYTWNGRDLDGRRVASGIYMVLVAKEDGSRGIVAKIGVVR